MLLLSSGTFEKYLILKTLHYNTILLAAQYLLKCVNAANQHVKVIQSRNWSCQVTFCMIELFNVTCYLLHLNTYHNVNVTPTILHVLL